MGSHFNCAILLSRRVSCGGFELKEDKRPWLSQNWRPVLLRAISLTLWFWGDFAASSLRTTGLFPSHPWSTPPFPLEWSGPFPSQGRSQDSHLLSKGQQGSRKCKISMPLLLLWKHVILVFIPLWVLDWHGALQRITSISTAQRLGPLFVLRIITTRRHETCSQSKP